MSNETPSTPGTHSLRAATRKVPVDAAVLFVLAVAGAVAFTYPSALGQPIRTVVGLPLLLVAPGYVLLAVLYPEASDRTVAPAVDGAVSASDHWLDWPARGALSLGVSVALVPLVALTCSLAGVALTSVPIVIAAFVAVGSVGAAYRRRQLPPGRRLGLPLVDRLDVSGLRANSLRSAGSAITLALAISVLLATATLGYALVVPNDGESYSSLSLATENETGAVVAGSYPTEFTDGEGRELVVGVENREGATVTYTVVVELQTVEPRDGTAVVAERTELQRFSAEVAAGETWERTHTVTPDEAGDDQRLSYSLYREGAPVSTAAEEPYRQTYLWIDVEPSGTN